eukprot:CAMPEP_0174250478 /NCGR_PEP_ID=MMETSP0439-20130205/639_1 /TAXON_ID=0 /ORGANISM="Stereomyxa ramosa, Strain Chinc5" /LENGTH=241 /DNA_ID=CAMNT_0015330563 /DNA_START=39 /DNA_END=764 /DNA_ORIENTATION=+
MEAVPPVPESLLKKRNHYEKLRQINEKKRNEVRKERREKRKIIFKRAESYVKEYRQQERELIRSRRTAKNAGYFFREPEPKLAFVIRIRGINGVDPKTRKILQLLRLRQINNGTFVKLNKASINMLKKVEPYIMYGYPNLKTVRELIYKRGFAKINRQRVPITSNYIIEQKLGHVGIICMEDLIHEIYTVGPNFKIANKFLWPIKLSNPRGGFKKKLNHFCEGGDAGNREDLINAMVRRMN